MPVQLAPPTFISGTASRNRTHIRRVEAYCILHYTIAVWCGGRDSNPQNSDFKSDMYTNSITSARTLLYLKQSYKSTGTSSEIRTHRIFSFWERRLYQFVHRGMVGWLRIELRLNRLWVDCFTIKLSAHVWLRHIFIFNRARTEAPLISCSATWWKIRESNPVTNFR